MAKPNSVGKPGMTHIHPKQEFYACIYVQDFPAQALLRLRPELRDKPCVVMQGEPPEEQVFSLNAKAYALGVSSGMTRVEIDTFLALTVLSRSLVEEAAAKDVLLECAGTFSPRIEDSSVNSSFMCVLDIAGTEKLHGPPTALTSILLERIKSLGFTARIAACANFHAAICLAHGLSKREIIVIPPGAESAALAPLPISVLNLSEEHAQTLYNWGIYTVGMLADLPEAALISRLGQSGKRLRMMAHGKEPHQFQPVEPAFLLEETMELDTPVELLDSLLFVLGVMLEQLILRAAARIYSLAVVTVTLTLDKGATHTRSVRPALPTNDRNVWLKLIRLDLEAHPPDEAIHGLTVFAEPGSTSKMQLGLFSAQLPEPIRLDVTLARIRAIVGDGFSGKAVLQDHHHRDSFRMEQFRLANTALVNPSTTQPRASMRRLRPPEPITMTLQRKVPKSFYSKQCYFTVERAYGPWIVSGSWWGSDLWSDNQWDVVARSQEGGLLCCCLVQGQADNSWHMFAIYD